MGKIGGTMVEGPQPKSRIIRYAAGLQSGAEGLSRIAQEREMGGPHARVCTAG